MGLLDQAIREHLELMRQHGADPGELTRLEREALGPPVRETQEVLAAAGGPARAAARQAPPGEPEPEPWLEEPEAEDARPATMPFDVEQAMADEGARPTAPGEAPSAGGPAHAAAPHAEAELSATPEEPGDAVEPEAIESVEPEAIEPVESEAVEPTEPAAVEPTEPTLAEPVEPAPAEPVEPEATEPVEPAPTELADAPEPPDREDAPPGDSEGDGDEDVLEETPEFLQETPEHDRLWFEQKPPRDFDFDG